MVKGQLERREKGGFGEALRLSTVTRFSGTHLFVILHLVREWMCEA